MLHRLFFMLCLAVLIPLQTFAQKTWVPFLQQTKSDAVTTLTSSNNSMVSFSVQINGMETSNSTIEEIQYQDISVPGCEVMTKEGLPQVPVITKLVAIPDCDNVSITVTPSNSLNFSNYNILPAPKFVEKKLESGSTILEPVFYKDNSVYASGADFPGKFGEITEVGYVRNQKVARVAIYPIQFNPADKSINVYTAFSISLSFINPKSSVNQELGIFRNMMHHVAMNYELSGISAETKVTGKNENISLSKASPSKVLSGSVTRVTNLSTLVGTNAISVDYLIITHSSLYNSSYLTTLANHRRDYNGYDVVIVHVDDMNGAPPNYDCVYEYYTVATHYQSVRDFIADVYNNGKANHTGDGHLGYICLVGDAYDDNNSEMLPAAYPSYYSSSEEASDYYYACTGGDSDNLLDVMYGRLPVGNETELSNEVNKITSYESNSNGSWNEKYTFINPCVSLYLTADSKMEEMTDMIPTGRQKSYAYRKNNTHHDTYVTNADPIYGQSFSTAEINDPSNLCGTNSLNNWIYSNAYAGINNGIHTFVMEGHGARTCLGPDEGCGRYIFYLDGANCAFSNSVNTMLNNNLYTFMIFNCCSSGWFDDGYSGHPDATGDCIAEEVQNFANKGSIGILASVRESNTDAFGKIDKYVLDAQYSSLSHIMGEAVMESKLQLGGRGYDLQFRRQYNLYGDPAVNLWPTGYTISQNLILSGDNTISENIIVASGITLTISAGAHLTFTNGSSLIVNGTLTASGSSASPITFNFTSPDSTTENGIKFNSGSSGTINYCKVQNAYRGIYENSVSVDITNSVLSYCTDGIYLYSSHPTISQNNIHHNSYAGIYLVSSPPSSAYSVIIKNNYIKNNSQYGVYCTTSSNPQIGNVNNTYGNAIENNYYGVFCWNNSIPKIGNYPLSEGGYNNIINNTYSVYNMSSNSVSAMYNWWGSTVPSNFGIAGTGGVGTSYYLSSSATIDPYPTLSKTASNYYVSGVSDIPLFSELNKANQLVASNNLTEAREVCLNLIKNYPDYSVSYNALNLLKETYVADDIAGKKNIYKSLFNSKEKKDIYAMAGLILADIDKENRLKQIDEVINNYAGESVVELALFDKLVYYNFELNDKENSRAVSKELDKLFPLSIGAIEAHRILGDKEYYDINIDHGKNLQKTSTQTPKEYLLSDNYPNPFNPTTTINFQIPEDGFVTLKVYDVLGREVASLVNENKKAGYYSRDFDASKLSSGVYIYKITANNFVQSKKMLMIK